MVETKEVRRSQDYPDIDTSIDSKQAAPEEEVVE